MRIEVISIFPELFETFSGCGLVGKAVQRELVSLACTTPRDFTSDVHRSVDDGPYGGGSGMVMTPRPLMEAVERWGPIFFQFYGQAEAAESSRDPFALQRLSGKIQSAQPTILLKHSERAR